MKRLPLAEIEDQPWCPRAVRDGGTDWLGFMANATRAFSAAVPKLQAAMDAMGTRRIVDLCAGGGGPWLTLARDLAGAGDVEVVLTDLYPNLDALRAVRSGAAGVRVHDDPVDATNVPPEFVGVRTMFNSFHHFRPALARAILADAVRKRQAIAVFEGFDHRALGVLAVLLQLPTILLLTPLVRPFRWSRLLLTYVLPLIPALVLFDGTVSVLRLYSPEELRALVREIDGHEAFDWDIGTTPVPRSPLGLIHLVGTPRA